MILDLGAVGTIERLFGLFGRQGALDTSGVIVQFPGEDGVVRSSRGIFGREIGFIGVALRAGEREDLRADDRGGTMHLAEMRQRKLSKEGR